MLSHFSCVWLFVALWTVTHQAPLSMGFSRQEYWSGLPFPSPGDLPNPGIEPMSLMFPALAARFFTPSTTWEAFVYTYPLFFGFPSHLDHHRALSRVPCAVHLVLISYFIRRLSSSSRVYLSIPVSQSIPHPPVSIHLFSTSVSLCRRPGFNPLVRKISWRRKWQPTPVFLPGKPRGQRSLVGYSGVAKSRTRLSDFTFTFCVSISALQISSSLPFF